MKSQNRLALAPALFIALFVSFSSAMAAPFIVCSDKESGAAFTVFPAGNSLHYEMNAALFDAVNKQMFPQVDFPAYGTGGTISNGDFYLVSFPNGGRLIFSSQLVSEDLSPHGKDTIDYIVSVSNSSGSSAEFIFENECTISQQ